jgi:Zn-dependent M28 family amino/carboxypeptidase
VGAGGEADFAEAAVAGRWALVQEEELNARTVRDLARDAGALGVLVTPGPGYSGDDYAERYASSMKRLLEARASWPRGAQEGEEGRGAPRVVYPMVCLTRAAAGRLFGLAGVDDAASIATGTVLAVRVHETRAIAGGGSIEVENVVGFWPGSDPDLARETIVISAHYDHIGTSGSEVNNGADDNGSGTCGLLAMAEALSRNGPLRRSVALIWVSGEEKGLWGSQAWVEDGGWLPDGERPICDINLDMIGRNDPASLLVTPTDARPKDYNGLVRLIERLAPLEGFTELGSADPYWRRSDHANFAKLGIPVTFLFADVHDDYHRPTDTPDKLDYDKIRRVVRLVLRVLDELQTDELDL